MGYQLQGAIATDPVLRKLAGTAEEGCIVPLTQRLCLLPMTDALFDAVTVAGAPTLDAFWKAPTGFGRALAACSAGGPITYVEADYFGGSGTQSAQVWDGGQVALGPLHLATGKPIPAEGSPISRALRRLGVIKGKYFDEFDAVGLGRHRETGDWLPPTS
ncbi:hypothetical protein AB0F52_25980 [Amycolatopsis sp. NPDC024027]|uniref:hypothetical protein n=1 Tax=Amycolatopsis sp. NPDC024027 TaxID=3154327 RepID=UPI0033FCD95F